MNHDHPTTDALDQGDLLRLTLDAAARDRETVTPQGEPTARLLAGVSRHISRTQVDERGSVVEMIDPRWGWHPDPVVTSYAFTLRPGMAKGWAMHKEHEDRYFMLHGEVEFVLYDVRPDSPTVGLVSRMFLSDLERCAINIPAYVWHATRNPGLRDATLVNFPTAMYDHASPDKYRLPLDTALIPFRFEGTSGW